MLRINTSMQITVVLHLEVLELNENKITYFSNLCTLISKKIHILALKLIKSYILNMQMKLSLVYFQFVL